MCIRDSLVVGVEAGAQRDVEQLDAKRGRPKSRKLSPPPRAHAAARASRPPRQGGRSGKMPPQMAPSKQ
eukprot:12230039-Alexandrium_andersonii.AAC.1